MKQESEEFWQAEPDEMPGPSSRVAQRHSTREEAETEARAKGYKFVARYRGKSGEFIRRAYPLRPGG